MKRRQLSELIFRLRHGFWCQHFVGVFAHEGFSLGGYSTWTPWHVVDGMRKNRRCTRCGRAEWV